MIADLRAGRRVVAVRLLAGATVLALAAFIASTFAWSDPGSIRSFFDDWVSNAMLVAAALVTGLRAMWVRQERLAWGLLAVGIGSFAAGDIYWTVAVQHLDPAPFPSLADYLYLAFYPFAYVSLALLVRERCARVPVSVWADGVVGGLGAAALGAAFAFGPILESTGGNAWAVGVNLAYPLGDLLLLAFVIGGFSLLGLRWDGPIAFLGLGFLLFAIGDTSYLFEVARDTYSTGKLLDASWPAGVLLMALAAWRPLRRWRLLHLDGWTMLAAPAAFTLSSVAILVYDHANRLPTLAVGLATATLVAAGVRTASTFRDVQALAASRVEARTDELTGLGNRRLLMETVDEVVGGLKPGEHLAVLLLDLDRFKEVNDSLGHPVGDELLRLIGPRLAGALRATDTLVRLGGDEFAALLPGASVAVARATAGRIRGALTQPFNLAGLAVRVDASVGVSVFPEHGHDSATLLRGADVAMYRAKSDRTGCQVYDPATDDHGLERLTTLTELRAALDDRRLVLHYQPKVDVLTGALKGVEALVRWPHPTRGLLYPDAFLELAEYTGTMGQLTDLVLDLALSQYVAWRDDGLDLPIAVNLSASNLLDAEFPGRVAAHLEELQVPPDALQLEITEETLMVDPVRTFEVLARLRDLGLTISIDDYGTGYSSLAYLRDLPVQELKLDKSFIMPMLDDPRSAAIVHSTIELAHSLGLVLVAEGVETDEVLRQLQELGCDIAQGYFISRPVPAADLTEWLRTRDTIAAR